MLNARTIDPLSAPADARLYVPTESAESALSAIASGLRAGSSPVLLSGPSGIGKTLLLQVLAEREFRSFAVRRFAAGLVHEPEELAGDLLRLLFGLVAPRRSRAAEAALLAELRAQSPNRTLLLVDDIHRENESLVRKLSALARAAQPALMVVVAGTACEERHELSDALRASLTVSLPKSLPESEIAAIYDGILAHDGLAPRHKRRLELADRAEITKLAHGVPQRLKSELAQRVLNGPASVPAAPRSAPALTRLGTSLAESVTRTHEHGRRLRDNLGLVGAHVRVAAAERAIAISFPPAARSKRRIVRAKAVAAGLLLLALAWEPFGRARSSSSAPAARVETSALPVPRTSEVAQINAPAWAEVSINGVFSGPTPLRRDLPSGVHRFEAEFPGGGRGQRDIDTGPAHRFVWLP